MICPKCEHTMDDGLIFCECCGSHLAAPQPKTRIVPTATRRIDLYAQPEQTAAASLSGTTIAYNMFEPAAGSAVSDSLTETQPVAAFGHTGAVRKHRRSRRMKTLFTVGIMSMFLMGFGGGAFAFANDSANARLPLIAEYEEVISLEAEAPGATAQNAQGTASTASTTTSSSATIILDDPVPLAAFMQSNEAASDAATSDSSASADSADNSAAAQDSEAAMEIGRYHAEAATSEPLAPCTLDINGTRVPYIRTIFAPICPDRNAALWAGDDSTTDGSFGYFVGHNPGDFACVYALTEGDRVTLCNADGNVRDYTVTKLFDISSDTYFEELLGTIVPDTESVVMQTCIGDGSRYRIVVCE